MAKHIGACHDWDRKSADREQVLVYTVQLRHSSGGQNRPSNLDAKKTSLIKLDWLKSNYYADVINAKVEVHPGANRPFADDR